MIRSSANFVSKTVYAGWEHFIRIVNLLSSVNRENKNHTLYATVCDCLHFKGLFELWWSPSRYHIDAFFPVWWRPLTSEEHEWAVDASTSTSEDKREFDDAIKKGAVTVFQLRIKWQWLHTLTSHSFLTMHNTQSQPHVILALHILKSSLSCIIAIVIGVPFSTSIGLTLPLLRLILYVSSLNMIMQR